MLDDQAMQEHWIIRVADKDYGPADFETLREWKREGRVIAQNPARRADVDPATVASTEETHWMTAAEITGLFEITPPPIGDEERLTQPPLQAQRRSLAQIIGETFRIYFQGFFQFFYLTLLVTLPWLCAQLSGPAVGSSPPANPDLTTAVAARITLCMMLLSIAAWPIFIAGIQILTAELAAGRKARIFELLGQIARFWPRVAILCLFVYGVFFLLLVFAGGIMMLSLVGASSPFIAVIALGLLVVQVWMFCHFFVNVLFWQQFAVLEDCDAGNALRQSKQLARSGRNLPFFQRPAWRGGMIVSLWMALLIALYIGPEWPLIRQYWDLFFQLSNAPDPQLLLQNFKESAQHQQVSATILGLDVLQKLLRPLLGIAFVLLYIDSRANLSEENLAE